MIQRSTCSRLFMFEIILLMAVMPVFFTGVACNMLLLDMLDQSPVYHRAEIDQNARQKDKTDTYINHRRQLILKKLPAKSTKNVKRSPSTLTSTPHKKDKTNKSKTKTKTNQQKKTVILQSTTITATPPQISEVNSKEATLPQTSYVNSKETKVDGNKSTGTKTKSKNGKSKNGKSGGDKTQNKTDINQTDIKRVAIAYHGEYLRKELLQHTRHEGCSNFFNNFQNISAAITQPLHSLNISTYNYFGKYIMCVYHLNRIFF